MNNFKLFAKLAMSLVHSNAMGKMGVSEAVQVLSKTVTASIQTGIDLEWFEGIARGNVSRTHRFVEKIDNLFFPFGDLMF